MKSLALALLGLMTFSAAPAFAEDLQPAHFAQKVRVVGVEATVEPGPWGATAVKITATFGNACAVPSANELILMTDYADNFGTLDLTVATISDRVCTMEYAPVIVTIDLGVFGRPNDGTFEAVKVNGVLAN